MIPIHIIFKESWTYTKVDANDTEFTVGMLWYYLSAKNHMPNLLKLTEEGVRVDMFHEGIKLYSGQTLAELYIPGRHTKKNPLVLVIKAEVPQTWWQWTTSWFW